VVVIVMFSAEVNMVWYCVWDELSGYENGRGILWAKRMEGGLSAWYACCPVMGIFCSRSGKVEVDKVGD